MKTQGQQKITNKILNLLEFLDKKFPGETSIIWMGDKELKGFNVEIRRRLDEISLEAFAEIELNECNHTRLRGQVGNDYVVCLDCGKEINEPLK